MSLNGVVFRAAIILAAAGFATYAIRLAGQHRHQGNWAKSIAVQLKSFEAFLEPVAPGQVKDAIYEHFARRVLGASLEMKSNSGDEAVKVSIHDLLSFASRRSS